MEFQKPADTTEKDKDDDERTTAIGLAQYAYQYLDAAMLVDQTHGQRPGFQHVSPVPAYFLALHGIELTLKSFLRHKGVTVKELGSRDLGHDLQKCHAKAESLGLAELFRLREEDHSALTLLQELNRSHGLRYIKTGAKVFPTWGIVEPFAVRLHQAVAPRVGFKSFEKTYAGYQ